MQSRISKSLCFGIVCMIVSLIMFHLFSEAELYFIDPDISVPFMIGIFSLSCIALMSCALKYIQKKKFGIALS